METYFEKKRPQKKSDTASVDMGDPNKWIAQKTFPDLWGAQRGNKQEDESVQSDKGRQDRHEVPEEFRFHGRRRILISLKYQMLFSSWA